MIKKCGLVLLIITNNLFCPIKSENVQYTEQQRIQRVVAGYGSQQQQTVESVLASPFIQIPINSSPLLSHEDLPEVQTEDDTTNSFGNRDSFEDQVIRMPSNLPIQQSMQESRGCRGYRSCFVVAVFGCFFVTAVMGGIIALVMKVPGNRTIPM